MAKKLDDKVVKNILSFAPVVVAGVVAVINALTERKQAQEFEALKQAVSELQNKE